MTFSEKIYQAREQKGWTQQELADKAGLSRRAIIKYEYNSARPRHDTLNRLASVLGVTTDYLIHDDLTDPTAKLETSPYVEMIQEKYGTRYAHEVADLLQRNTALFAGGDLSESAKDDFFQAIMAAYMDCKNASKQKYGRKAKRTHTDSQS